MNTVESTLIDVGPSFGIHSLLSYRQRAEQGAPPRLPGRQDGDEPPRREDAEHEGRQCL